MELSIQEKMKYICTNIRYLTREDKISVGRVVKNSQWAGKIKETNTGIRIVLDGMDENTINSMYQIVKYHMDKSK
jgi:hypothetical protein